MKARAWSSLGMCVAMIVGVVSATQAQTTTDVYKASVHLKGWVRNDTPPPFAKVVIGTTQSLINLALGNDPKTVVPPNVILAILVPVDGNGSLAVFDVSTNNVLAVIGTFVGPAVRTSPTRKVSTYLLPIENVGNASFGLTGGDLMVDAILVQPQGAAAVKANGAVTGWLDLTVTDDTGTHTGPIPITVGKITASHLATVVLP